LPINTGSLTRLRLSSADYQTVEGSEGSGEQTATWTVTERPDGALYYRR